MSRIKKMVCQLLIVLMSVVFVGCTESTVQDGQTQLKEGLAKLYQAGSYDSQDMAAVVKLDTVNKTITLRNMEKARNYTLQYDATLSMEDKYGTTMDISQVQIGDFVQVRFLLDKKQAVSLAYVKDYWEYTDVQKFSMDEEEGVMIIGSERYLLHENVMVFSEGVMVRLMDINAADVLTVWGNEQTIYGIVVTSGHGYLRLTNDSYFIGGWIEIGQMIIRRITEDMLIVVPEGEYQVRISGGGNVGTKQLLMQRNAEVELDLSDIEVKEPLYCEVTFQITPEDAMPRIYVNNQEVSEGEGLLLEYGVHTLNIHATGYESMAMYLKVGSSSYTFHYALTAIETEEDESSGEDEQMDDTTSDGTDTEDVTGTTSDVEAETSETSDTTTTAEHYLYIDSPDGAEVYIDGNYQGIAPLNIRKKEGSYVITLRRTGYQTRSYTIYVDGEEEDSHYAFSSLVSLSE